MNYLNRCIWRAVSSGAGPFVVASAITGYLIPEDCVDPAVVDNGDYHAIIYSDDLSQWIIVDGVYTVADDTFTVTITHDTSSGFTSFSAAPIVIMGCTLANDVAFRGYENVTTDNATPATINPNVLITNVTTDGSGLEQTIELPSIDSTQSTLQHVVILKTQTDPSDVLRVTGASNDDFLISSEGGSAAYNVVDANWYFFGGIGAFDAPSTGYPFIYALTIGGGFSIQEPRDYTDWYFRAFDVVIAAGAGTADDDYFKQFIVTDGTGTPAQTVNLGVGDPAGSMGRLYLFYLTNHVDPSDTVVITSNIGIVGSEVITLPGLNAWALFMVTVDGLLPMTFGGGATTDATGSRVLTLADTGGLSWV